MRYEKNDDDDDTLRSLSLLSLLSLSLSLSLSRSFSLSLYLLTQLAPYLVLGVPRRFLGPLCALLHRGLGLLRRVRGLLPGGACHSGNFVSELGSLVADRIAGLLGLLGGVGGGPFHLVHGGLVGWNLEGGVKLRVFYYFSETEGVDKIRTERAAFPAPRARSTRPVFSLPPASRGEIYLWRMLRAYPLCGRFVWEVFFAGGGRASVFFFFFFFDEREKRIV